MRGAPCLAPRRVTATAGESLRQPNLPDDPVVPAIKRKVVEHNVSCRNPEGSLDIDQPIDDVVTNEVDFGVAFRLRIGEEHDVKALRLAQ
jgi:hypothetical protein